MACSRVTIGTTGRAEALTLLPAQREGWNGEQPFLTHSRTEIKLSRPSGDRESVMFVRVVETRLGKEHMHVFRYSNRHVAQAPPALRDRRPFQPAAQIKATVTCSRESTSHVHTGTSRARVVRLPHRIRRVQHSVHALGAGFQTPDVKAQHSRVT